MIIFKRLHAVLIALLTTLASISCVTVSEDIDKKNAAILVGDLVSPFSMMNGGAHISINELDEERFSVTQNKLYLAPGLHEIGFHAASGTKGTQQYLEYTFESGKKYKISGKYEGLILNVQLDDITQKTQKILKTWKFGEGVNQKPLRLPFGQNEKQEKREKYKLDANVKATSSIANYEDGKVGTTRIRAINNKEVSYFFRSHKKPFPIESGKHTIEVYIASERSFGRAGDFSIVDIEVVIEDNTDYQIKAKRSVTQKRKLESWIENVATGERVTPITYSSYQPIGGDVVIPVVY